MRRVANGAVNMELYSCVTVRTIDEKELAGWGKSYYEALEVAISQLAQDNFVFASAGDSIHLSATGDTYDASRLLLVDPIRRLSVQGTPVAMIPSRDQLLLTGSDDIDGLKAILRLAEDGYREAACPSGKAAISDSAVEGRRDQIQSSWPSP